VTICRAADARHAASRCPARWPARAAASSTAITPAGRRPAGHAADVPPEPPAPSAAGNRRPQIADQPGAKTRRATPAPQPRDDTQSARKSRQTLDSTFKEISICARMAPDAVRQHGRTLQRLRRDNLAAVALLKVVAGAQSSGRSRGRYEGPQPQARLGLGHGIVHCSKRLACAPVVDEVVTELRKLVEDAVASISGQFCALVVNLLEVALGSRSADNVRSVTDPILKPRETLPAHPFGQHGHPRHPIRREIATPPRQ
jgi:hypothetical protein